MYLHVLVQYRLDDSIDVLQCIMATKTVTL